MLKEKRSFLERITGAKQMGEMSEVSINAPIYAEEEQETYMHMNTLTESPMQSTEQPVAGISNASEWSETADADGQLTIDMHQTESDIVIKSTIAGVRPEDLDVAINNDMIIIKGERRSEDQVPQENYYYQECYWGPFSRSIVLPVDILPEKAEAALKNGILTVKLPKADTNKVKRIQVRGF